MLYKKSETLVGGLSRSLLVTGHIVLAVESSERKRSEDSDSRLVGDRSQDKKDAGETSCALKKESSVISDTALSNPTSVPIPLRTLSMKHLLLMMIDYATERAINVNQLARLRNTTTTQ